MIAPASLKRPYRLSPARGEHAPLRGMIAPASLKQGLHPRDDVVGHPLRGMIAPASLKRGGFRPEPEGQGHHSGA